MFDLLREKRTQNCQYDEYDDQDIGYADIQITARSPKEVFNLNIQTICLYSLKQNPMTNKIVDHMSNTNVDRNEIND